MPALSGIWSEDVLLKIHLIDGLGSLAGFFAFLGFSSRSANLSGKTFLSEFHRDFTPLRYFIRFPTA